MFLEINEPSLLQSKFEKVYMKGSHGSHSVFYYRQGLYLKCLRKGFYAVYNNDMNLLSTINNFYQLEVILIAKEYSLVMN
jgi:hypothetical protein